MSEHGDARERHGGADAFDDGPAGTDCALCGTDISPNQYWSSRAVLVEEDAREDDEAVKMVCQDCWADLDANLSVPSK